MRVYCPKCGTEMEQADKNAREIPEYLRNSDISAYLVPKNNKENKGETTMRRMNNNTTTTTNNELVKENTTMMNGMNMELLAQMVAEKINTNVNNAVNTTTNEENGSQWAKNSKFYGKELCGYAYNPYLVRRFLPEQFKTIMKDFDLNVDEGIRCCYTYMDSIKYMIKECEKLAMLNKRDKIAYEERRCFWSVKDCKDIFMDYLDDCTDHISNIEKTLNANSKYMNVKGIGRVDVNVKEVIENHKIVLRISSRLDSEIENTFTKLSNATTYKEIAEIMRGFKLIKLNGVREYNWQKGIYVTCKGYKLSKSFVEGFKKSGAYYTLADMIMFGNAEFKGLRGREAMDLLKANIYQPAYVLYAMLKEVIANNR